MIRFLFGGKGGVGKTTISTAFATLLAQKYNVLLISTDPAHSLSDIFNTTIGNSETQIPLNGSYKGSLKALELDPGQAIQQYKTETLKKVRKLGLHLDFNVEKYIDTISTSPGAYETAIFDQFSTQLRRTDVEVLVFDTAPTGTTLQLLQMSRLIPRWIKIILHSRIDLLKLQKMYHKNTSDDAIITELEKMRGTFKQVRDILKQKSTHFIFVLTPEKLPFNETTRAIHSLMKNGLKLTGIVVNRIIPPEKIQIDGFREMQQLYLQKIRDEWPKKILAELSWYSIESQGIAEIIKLAHVLQNTRLQDFITT